MARVRGTQIYSPDIVEELKQAMAIQSRAGEDDEATFRQKMNALQRFLNHGMSRFSIDNWHHALTTLYHAYNPHPNNHHHPVMTKLCGLDDLRALSRDVILGREGGSVHEAEAQSLKYAENFMSALHCVREAKACIADLHRFLYRCYYDPDSGRERSQARSSKGLSRSSTMAAGKEGEPNVYEQSARQFGILTLQQMSGTTSHKLRRTVADMQQIMTRWDRLMTEGQIQPEDLDPESLQDLHMLTGTSTFEPVLRLLPDIFAKFYKCLELLKQWWVLAHEIYPELPIRRPATAATQDSDDDVEEGTVGGHDDESEMSVLDTTLTNESLEDQVALTEQLEKVEGEIRDKEDLMVSLNDELRLLMERDRHFESLVEAYEKVTAQLEDQTRELKELVAAREKETFPSQNQLYDGPGTDGVTSVVKPHTSVDDLNQQVSRAEREMQLLQFQQSLLRQDYMVQLEVRPSMIRFADDLRIRLETAQRLLTEDKMEKIKLNTLLEEQNNENKLTPSSVPDTDQPPTYDMLDTDASPSQDLKESSPELSPSPQDGPTNPEANKAAERKLELSRLLAKPRREDTTSSSVHSELTPVEPKRRKSHPVTKPDHSEKSTAPVIKITRDTEGKTANSGELPKKSPRLPTGPSTDKSISPQARRKTSVPEAQSRTETLFQRRAARKAQGSETSGEKNGAGKDQSSEQPVSRPRAKSDPHTDKPEPKTSKSTPDKLDKSQPNRVNTNGYSPKSKSDEIKQDTDARQQKAKVTGTRKTSLTTSPKPKPDDVIKSSVSPKTLQSDSGRPTNGQMNGALTDKETRRRKSKSEDSVVVSLSSKPKESRKNGDRTSPTSKTGINKTDSDKPLPKTSSKDTHVPSSKPNEKEDEKKRQLASLKLKEKGLAEASSRKASRDDVKKDSVDITSQTPSQNNKKPNRTLSPEKQKQRSGDDKGDVKSGHRPSDAKKDVEVTSQKSNPAGRPNGVLSKGKKTSYAHV